ncbi:MAG: trigger factor [Oscillospiraceae bacterium]|nr:trigger factor [Oscillospiraceae bacterium]
MKLNLKSIEKKEKNMTELIVKISREEFDAAKHKAYIKNKNQIAVPGFRRGKAPRKIIENMYGNSVFYNDALDIILPDVVSFSVKEKGDDVRLASFPQVTDVDIKDDESAEITLNAALYPEVTLGEYKGLSAVKPAVEVADVEIDSELAALQTRNARTETVDRPAINGDTAVMDFEGFVDGVAFDGGKGENYELELGSGTFIPGFEEKVQGMVTGEERDLDLVFPENYSENLAGKAVVFKVKLNEVKSKIMPELDDEFAKDVSEFDTLEEYKADIRAKIAEAKQQEADAAFENALMEKIIESIEVELPDAMVAEHMENSINNFTQQISAYGMNPEMYLQMMNLTPEQFQMNMRDQSVKQLKTMLVLEKIAELEGVKVTDEDIESEYAALAERYGMEVDTVKQSLETEAVTGDLKMRAAAKIVTENATAEAPPAESEVAVESEEKESKPAAKKPAAKKPATKKPAAEKAEAATSEEKKPAAKKSPAKKAETEKTPAAEKKAEPAAKKPAAKKPAATATADGEKKPAAKKPAAKKPPAKKAEAPKED